MGRSLLTDETRTRIIEATRSGAYVHDAAAYAGVHRDTVFGWLARGRAALAREQGIDDPDWSYAEFTEQVILARSQAKVEATTELRAIMIDRAVDPNVRVKAITWWLERSAPEDWARSKRPEVQSSEDEEARRQLEQQQQGAMLSQALRGILGELGVPLDDATASVVRRHLVAVVAETPALTAGAPVDEVDDDEGSE